MDSVSSQNPTPWWWIIATAIMMWAATSILFGCKTKYIETQRVVDRYTHSVDTIHDSVSSYIFINQYVKGDTVFMEKTNNLYKYKYINKVDTFIQHDSIPYYITKTVEKKAKSTWFDKIKSWLFYPLLTFSFGCLAVWLIRKFI